jgi:hypothetical protein
MVPTNLGAKIMGAINKVLQSRSIAGGHIVELDLQSDDNSKMTLQIQYPIIPILMRMIWDAAAAAETIQRQASGGQMMAVVIPYRMQDMRAGRSPDGTVVADFRTDQGPVQLAMKPDQVRTTIERLSAELDRLGTGFPKPS